MIDLEVPWAPSALDLLKKQKVTIFCMVNLSIRERSDLPLIDRLDYSLDYDPRKSLV